MCKAIGTLFISNVATGVFLKTFRRLKKRGIVPSVFYPAVQLPSDEDAAEVDWEYRLDPDLAGFLHGKRVFLSINRFERKKVHVLSQNFVYHSLNYSPFPFLSRTSFDNL